MPSRPTIFEWLSAHQRDAFPAKVDCETGSPQFTHCYWVEVTKFDPAESNDVLDSTRVAPLGSGAVLAIGPFGYNPADPGPGVLVASLPEKYAGPLKLNDRIVELGGKELKDGPEFAQILYQTTEEKPVVVMVERGKEHVRLETRIDMAPRAELVTARVRAQYLPDLHEVEVVSRAITQMKLTLPEAWMPARITWNGTEVGNVTHGRLLAAGRTERAPKRQTLPIVVWGGTPVLRPTSTSACSMSDPAGCVVGKAGPGGPARPGGLPTVFSRCARCPTTASVQSCSPSFKRMFFP